jgi:hypothetical protein
MAKKFTEKDIDKMMEEVLEGAINPQTAPQMSLLQRYKTLSQTGTKPNAANKTA